MTEEAQAPKPQKTEVSIDGEKYRIDDLSFLDVLTWREQNEVRQLGRELAGEWAGDAEINDLGMIDVIPAFVYVIRKRTDDAITFEEVLNSKLTDLTKASARPTRRRAAKTGSQSS